MVKNELSIYCPACGSNKISGKWPTRQISGNKVILWCAGCGFGWQHPLPENTDIKQLYSRQSVYELALKNESNLGFIKRIKRLCAIKPAKGKLLDVGSGPGHFLDIARKKDWQVEGVEPRIEAARYCHEYFGIKPKIGFLEDFVGDSSQYDVITCWDVLEHVSDHIHFFDRCIELLAPGGIFAFSIPNASGFPARIFKGRWRYIMSVHLNYFTMGYIYKLLSSRRLQVIHADHTFKIHSLIQGIVSYIPLEIDLTSLFNIGIGNNDVQMEDGKTVGNSKKHNTKSRILKSVRRLVSRINMLSFPVDKGDLVDFYCRK